MALIQIDKADERSHILITQWSWSQYGWDW